MMRFAEHESLIASDCERMRILGIVRALGLPDCWVAAGFVRNCVWDHLHRTAAATPLQDIDVFWYDPGQATADRDALLETALRGRDGALGWSVKNQACMHERNADRSYRSATDAMRNWPETATAVGVRLDHRGVVEVAAPFGLDDLFDLVVRPTARFAGKKLPLYRERVRAKAWQLTWPGLRIALPQPGQPAQAGS